MKGSSGISSLRSFHDGAVNLIIEKNTEKGNTESGTHTLWFSYYRRKKYLKGRNYFSHVFVRNSRYDLGPYYLSFIGGLNFPVVLKLSIRKLKTREPGKFIERLLAERKAEYRMAGASIQVNNTLKTQIEDGERMLSQLNREGSAILHSSIIFRILAGHPATLKDRMDRLVTDLALMDFETVEFSNTSRGATLMFDYEMPGDSQYLMNSRHISRILPFLMGRDENHSGILLGVDDITTRPVFIDPYSESSHNSLIIGETGSGKSFFAKVLARRLVQEKKVSEVLIFDPLNEYHCGYFGSNCRVIFPGNNGLIREETSPGNAGHVEAGYGNINLQENQPNKDEPVVLIFKPGVLADQETDNYISRILDIFNFSMMKSPSLPRLLIFDECHLILRNASNASALNTMVRHSRHYKTAIVNISQNVDDFLNARSSSLAFNSNRIFIFRNRSLNEHHAKILKIDDFDIDPPEGLMGGKNHPYSECIVTDGKYCRKLRIISTEEEKNLQFSEQESSGI